MDRADKAYFFNAYLDKTVILSYPLMTLYSIKEKTLDKGGEINFIDFIWCTLKFVIQNYYNLYIFFYLQLYLLYFVIVILMENWL